MNEVTQATKDISQLRTEREKIESQIKEIQKTTKREAVQEIVQMMNTFDVSIKVLTRRVNKVTSTRKIPPKVIHTPTGATWSGRGKTPRWYKEDWENVVKL